MKAQSCRKRLPRGVPANLIFVSPSPLRRLSLFRSLFVHDFQAVVCLMVDDLEAEKVVNRSDSDWLCITNVQSVCRLQRFLSCVYAAYSGDVISTFRRDVNSHSDDVNKVGAQRRWGCNHATRFCPQSRGRSFIIISSPFLALYMVSALSTQKSCVRMV